MADLAAYLRELRKKRGLLIKEVARATNGQVPENYISLLETGRIAKPAPDRLRMLAEVYGVPAADLLVRAGYLTEREVRTLAQKPRQQASESAPGAAEGPLPLEDLEEHSPGLREFVESSEARLMRLTWSEVRKLLALRFYGGPRSKTAQDWREILLDIRKWDDRSPFGLDNPDSDLVWKED